MDGIPSGLSSMTPILPQTLTIGDRGGLNIPPVEVMPVPVDSFGSDGDTAEMRSNSYAPNLDARGAWSGNVHDTRAAGRAASAVSGRMLPDAAAGGAQFGAAYSLSLGKGEDVPVPPEIARELTRVRNYELLGRTAPRQVYRRNPDTGAVEHDTAESAAGRAPQLPVNLAEEQPPLASPKGRISIGASVSDTVQLTAEETAVTQEPDAAETLPLLRSGGLKLADRLTASDYEAILTLEPELREALIGMLADDNIALSLLGQDASSAAPAAAKPGNAPAPADAALALLADEAGGTDPASFRNLLTALLGRQDLILNEARPGVGEASMGQISDLAHGATAAAGLPSRLAAAIMAAAVPDARGAAEAGIANLQKITELPYALYLFGNITIEKRPADEEEDDAPVRQKQRMSGPATELLRLSEAVKMAAVLHSIYHGGSGYFPSEVPWYAPYVSYAVKHGIIRGDEFSDFGTYATRAETAYIFSGCVPKAEFPVLNYAPRLVDVDEDTEYGAHICLLCRAGVLTGGDKDGHFYPEGMLTRSEAATIIGRIATPGDRKRF